MSDAELIEVMANALGSCQEALAGLMQAWAALHPDSLARTFRTPLELEVDRAMAAWRAYRFGPPLPLPELLA